jgi:hypothetical protein
MVILENYPLFIHRLKTVARRDSPDYFCPANQIKPSKANIMKQAILLATAALAITFTTSCNRQEVSDPGANSVKTYVPNNGISHSTGRLVGAAYSQPIAIDSANKMIGSYLESVGWPSVDTTVRSLSFDADTLRNYLKDKDITTVRFYLGHQLSWLNGGGSRFGKNIGMSPGKLTIIMAGLDDEGAIVRNRANGVYEHAMPCPNNCGPSATSAFLQ